MAITEFVIWGIYVVLFVGALFNPVSGILAYLTVYFTYNPDVWWAQSIISTLKRPSLIAMAFLVFGCLFNLKQFNWKISRREKEFYAFLIIAWTVSLFWGPGINADTWRYLEKLTKIFIFIFILLRVVNSFTKYKIILWGMILGGIFLAYQAHTTGGFFDGRLNSVGGIDFREANAFASFLAAMIIFLGFEMLNSPLWRRGLSVVFIAGMANTIVMTQSRAVFLGMAMGALFAIPLAPRKRRFAITSAILLGALLFLMLSDTKFIDRVNTISTAGQKVSGIIDQNLSFQTDRELNRIDYWRSSTHIFSDYPFGIGVKNFEKIVPSYDPRNPGMDAHNTYVLCYTELGILGITVFLVILTEALFQLRRIRLIARATDGNRDLENHATALTLVLIVYSLGLMMTHSILYNEFLWILLSLPICLENAAFKLKPAKIEQDTGS